MTNDERLAMETRIDAALFGRRGRFGGVTWPFTTNWSLLPSLVAKCVDRGWEFTPFCNFELTEPWIVELEFAVVKGYDVREGEADSLPLALCRAIVAVLDALGETTKAGDDHAASIS